MEENGNVLNEMKIIFNFLIENINNIHILSKFLCIESM